MMNPHAFAIMSVMGGTPAIAGAVILAAAIATGFVLETRDGADASRATTTTLRDEEDDSVLWTFP